MDDDQDSSFLIKLKKRRNSYFKTPPIRNVRSPKFTKDELDDLTGNLPYGTNYTYAYSSLYDHTIRSDTWNLPHLSPQSSRTIETERSSIYSETVFLCINILQTCIMQFIEILSYMYQYLIASFISIYEFVEGFISNYLFRVVRFNNYNNTVNELMNVQTHAEEAGQEEEESIVRMGKVLKTNVESVKNVSINNIDRSVLHDEEISTENYHNNAALKTGISTDRSYNLRRNNVRNLSVADNSGLMKTTSKVIKRYRLRSNDQSSLDWIQWLKMNAYWFLFGSLFLFLIAYILLNGGNDDNANHIFDYSSYNLLSDFAEYLPNVSMREFKSSTINGFNFLFFSINRLFTSLFDSIGYIYESLKFLLFSNRAQDVQPVMEDLTESKCVTTSTNDNAEINSNLIKSLTEKYFSEITTKFRADILNEIEEKMKKSCNIDIKNEYDPKYIEERFRSLLSIYDSDKTGMFDYALESAGASVISTRCSETYLTYTRLFKIWSIPLWFSSYGPRTVIQRNSKTIYPGECWCFKRNRGYLTIELSHQIDVTSLSYEHIGKEQAPGENRQSAPKHFIVWAYADFNDISTRQRIGTYHYELDGDALQTFSAQNRIDFPVKYVEFEVTDNYGAEYTCLYRLRVHGNLYNHVK